MEITSIVIAICAVIGVIISYLKLKADLKKEINTINTIISTINSGQAQGNQYCNCTFYSDVHDKKSINNEFNEQSK